MSTLPWLKDTVDQWLKIILNKQVPHAVLITGAEGFGKMKFAKEMAHLLMCENLTTKGVCHQCSSCILFQAGNHTDFSLISAEKEVVKVSQIRKLTQDVVLSSTRNQHKVYIIQRAEQMNKSAANALLKTLEEPPKNVVIILTTSEIGKLLPTIKSRCSIVTVKQADMQVSINWLQKQSSCQVTDLSLGLALANGAPLKALDIIENKGLEQTQLMLGDLKKILTSDLSIMEVSKYWIKENYTKNILLIASYFLSELKSINHMGTDNNGAQYFSNRLTKHRLFNDKLLSFIDQLYLFDRREKSVLKTELLLEELLIKYKNSFATLVN